jgi:hypothetical protein
VPQMALTLFLFHTSIHLQISIIRTDFFMTAIDQRYLVRQRKINATAEDLPVYAKAMRSKTGEFEGVSFIRNKEKASVMTMAEAEQVVAWAAAKKDKAQSYATTIICQGQ